MTFDAFEVNKPLDQLQSKDQYTTVPRVRLCKTEEVADGEVRKVETAGLVLAVYHVGSEFFVTDDACTHGPGSLSEGFLECDVIECNFHQGRFNVRTGAVVLPPCTIPIKTYKTIVEEGAVQIEL
jgi:nitrite reductase/ring-hydroxylating ferredoxin subunit